MENFVYVVVFAAGMVVVLLTLGSAVRTVVLPRGIPAKLTTAVFLAMRALFRLRVRRRRDYASRDRILAAYAPVSLLVMALVWLTIVMAGYAAMFWALEEQSVRDAVTLSGSCLLTIGFVRPGGMPSIILGFSEAAIGLALLALVITYLPSLYNAFSRREVAVTRLEVRAGSPPSGVEMLTRYARIGWMEDLVALWDRWEGWFVEVEESHTSFPSLVFFRSPQPDHSWVTAAGAVLDAASLASSTMEQHDPDAELCIRSGYLALRRIADFYGIPYDPDPDPSDPISVTREEFDEAYDRMAEADIPLKPDRDQAWRDFSGWRVNYDAVLLIMCALVEAPVAPWSSDRAPLPFRPRLVRRPGANLRRARSAPNANNPGDTT